MTKKKKIDKTLVEKILDKKGITYASLQFATEKTGTVENLDVSSLTEDRKLVYKTLVASGDKTGPVVGVIPIDEHLNLKKLAKASGNKKVEMIPLKNLEKTTGYVHGANTPIGIFERHHFPIFIDQVAEDTAAMVVSAGKIGRSLKINPQDLAKVTQATFVDLLE